MENIIELLMKQKNINGVRRIDGVTGICEYKAYFIGEDKIRVDVVLYEQINNRKIDEE